MDHRTSPRRTNLAALAEAGRVARQRMPRKNLGIWDKESSQRDPLKLLEQQESTRVPELIPLRHHRMAVSPFAFYRGSAIIMAHDLGHQRPHSGLHVQLSGDAHLANFGLFAAPDRTVVFDINDFDETHEGPFEWDVLRLSTSFLLASDENALSERVAREIAFISAKTYRHAMLQYASMHEIDIWYQRFDEAWLENLICNLHGKAAVERIRRYVAKARASNRWSAVEKLTETLNGHPRFLDLPPLLTRIPLHHEAQRALNDLFDRYADTLSGGGRALLSRYQLVDAAHKVVGVGSVGLLAYVYLLKGYHSDDLLVLQAKEAVASVIAPFSPTPCLDEAGRRVVQGQRLMQAQSDLFLGWLKGPSGRTFYVRQLRDMKWSPDIDRMDEEELISYAHLCGRTLARAHARSGRSVSIAAYLGKSEKFEEAVATFAERYGRQVKTDHEAFRMAIKMGTLPESGGHFGLPNFKVSARGIEPVIQPKTLST